MNLNYSFSLPPLPGHNGMAWQEGEQQAIIVDLENAGRVLSIEAVFAENCRADLPEAVYYHFRKGAYRVYGLVNYDNCSGSMTFYGKKPGGRPGEMSKIIPRGAGAKSLAYMPNERAVLLLRGGFLYKIDRYSAKTKMAVPMTGRAVFAGRNIYVAEGSLIKEYSPKGGFLRSISPGLDWAGTINSGAVNHRDGVLYVGSPAGRLATISRDHGGSLAEGSFDKAPSGFRLAGYNGELLIAACSATRKIYWLDTDFREVASIDYGQALSGTPLISFDGRDLLALAGHNGRLFTCNIQDNWEYAGLAHTAAPKAERDLSPKIPGLDNIYIFYSEFNWDKDRLKSVLGYLDSRRKACDIMFDGLLLMAQTCGGKSLMGDRPSAGLPEWRRYLETLMDDGGSYATADLAAREIREEASLPGFKPRVFIGLPYRMGRWERCRWFIDRCLQSASGYNNLILTGFYHMEEFKPDPLSKRIKAYLNDRGLLYIWSPGYPARRRIKKHRALYDAVFYQTGYPWGYMAASRGKERELTLALNNILNFHIRPNVESMNDTRWFTFARDRAYSLWDILLNYGIYSTTRLHFTGSSQIPDSCFSVNPFERSLYDLYHEFLRGRRRPGMASPLYKREKEYRLCLPEGIIADKVRIMPRFTRNPHRKKTRTLWLKSFDIGTEDKE